MADLRSPIASIPTQGVQPSAARSETVRAAQRAFFDAALGKSSAAPKPVEAVRSSANKPQDRLAGSPTRFDPQTPPSKMLRPGSLLDIKV